MPADETSDTGRDPTRGPAARWAWSVLVVVAAALLLRGGVAGGVVTSQEADFVRTLLEVKGRVEQSYVREVPAEALREAAINGMLSLTTDRNTAFFPPREAEVLREQLDGEFAGIGVVIRPAEERDESAADGGQASGGLRVTRVIPGGPAGEAGLLRGDVIIRADDVDLRGLSLVEAQAVVRGDPGSPVSLEVERDDGTLDFKVTRAIVKSPVLDGIASEPDGEPRFILEADDLPGLPTLASGELPRVAYVRLREFTPTSGSRLLEVLRQLQADAPLAGLVLDLRFNPGGRLDEAVGVADLFLPADRLITWDEGQARTGVPAVATAAPGLAWLDALPLVVLVNGQSASASEVVAGALGVHGRATLVGQRTFGKGSVQTILPVGAGGRLGTLKLTEAFYHLPDGRVLDREAEGGGVEADVVVPPAEAPTADDFADDRPPFMNEVWRAVAVLVAELAAERPARATIVEPIAAPTTLPGAS